MVFLHPRCPCSAATLGELNRILARAPGLQVTLVFFDPDNGDETWGSTALRRSAEAFKGDKVRIVDDRNGTEASNFGAQSSGHSLLYSAKGTLLFAGGITASRGHEGDNPGAEAIVALVTGREAAASHTPTFGCELSGAAGCSVCAEAAR